MAAVTHPPEWTTPQSSFRSRDDWSLKWWVMFALILSVVFHMMLVVGFDTLGISNVVPAKPRDVPERIRIDERALKEQDAMRERAQPYLDDPSLVRSIVADGCEDSALGRAVGRDRKGVLSLVLYAVAIPLAPASSAIARCKASPERKPLAACRASPARRSTISMPAALPRR